MDENPTAKKGFSILIGLLTFLLIGFGFTVLGFLGYTIYKNPPQKLSDISRIVALPSPSSSDSKVSLVQNSSSQSASSSSAITITPLSRNDFKSSIQSNAQIVFSDSKYSEVITDINLATTSNDNSQAYTNYKKAFNLIASAYNDTKNLSYRSLMGEIKLYCTQLPDFKDEDMQIPS